jgi:phosphatidylglycerophosphatase A
MNAALVVATLGGVGRMKPGPGTWGSAVVLPLALLGPGWCLAFAALLTVLGWWAVERVLAGPEEDPGWVVVDEGVGMLLALAGLAGPSLAGVGLAFLLFRLLDIAKPWPVSWADRQGGARGVMLDDIVAGAIAAVVLLAFARFYPGAI